MAAAGTITREVLREFCLQYPPLVLADSFTEAGRAVQDATAAVDDAAGQREELTRAAPHKMDENLWRTREQLEEVIVLCRDNAVLRRVAAEPATQIQTAAQTLLDAIKAMQAEQMLYVQQLVTKLMPKDFRTSMMLSYQKRSEVRAAEELRKFETSGRSIKEKYDWLWETQLKRRQMLVSVGNATGVFKAVIKYVAGVPQMLLDFVKTINDEQGPLEEVRATYGPVNYALTEYINRIHVLLALTAASTGDDAKLASLVAVAGSAMAQFQTEMTRSLTLSMAVFKNSPMIKIAETASQKPLAGQISVEARSHEEVILSVEEHQVGHEIVWDFTIESRDINFRVDYVPPPPEPSADMATDGALEDADAAGPAEPSRQTVVNPERFSGKVAGTHKPQQPGTYYLHWDNTYSLLTRKVVRYDIKLVPPGGAASSGSL